MFTKESLIPRSGSFCLPSIQDTTTITTTSNNKSSLEYFNNNNASYHTSISASGITTKMPVTFTSDTKSATSHSIYNRPTKKPRMSITQTYFLAHTSRGKLSKEAARPDHDLRLLVGHANLLDSLMLDLASAESEQERWFNKTVSGAQEEAQDEDESSAHVETIEEEEEEEEDAEITAVEVDSDMEEDEEMDSEELTLVRTPSRHSPPALTLDSDSDSDDESMPPSPPQPTFELSEEQRKAIATTSYYQQKELSISPVDSEAFDSEGFYLPAREIQQPLIAAY